jgi:hypothetical protein
MSFVRLHCLVVVIFTFLISSCKTEDDNTNNIKKPKRIIGSQTNIETLFDQTTFPSDIEPKLLKELEICNLSQRDLQNHLDPACNPKFFRFFPFVENKDIKDAFLLQIKARVNNFPLRRLLVFEREKGQLVKVNGFVANLIGTRISQSKHHDLVLRFNDNVGMGDIVFYNCLYQWENNHYVFKKIEQINDANVKAEFQDSMNVVIANVIKTNRMEF